MPEPSVRGLIEKVQKEELSSCWLSNL